MFAYAAIPLTCWLAVFIATPRRPLPGNEIEELVYARLLGRQQRLRLLALVATALLFLVFVLTLPQRVDPDLRDVRAAGRICNYPSVGFPTCYRLQPGGMWAQEELVDGAWVVVGTVATLPPINDPYSDPGMRNR
jgi:hypothetical protein